MEMGVKIYHMQSVSHFLWSSMYSMSIIKILAIESNKNHLRDIVVIIIDITL